MGFFFFFFAVVKLFGNRFDLIKSIKIRSRGKVDDSSHRSSSRFNSYESIIMNGFNKTIQHALVINSANSALHAYQEYRICNNKAREQEKKLHRSQELLLSGKKAVNYLPSHCIYWLY